MNEEEQQSKKATRGKTPDTQTSWLTDLTANQTAAAAEAMMRQDVAHVQEMADQLDVGYNKTWQGYDNDQRVLLQWVQSAGVAFENQLAGYRASNGSPAAEYKVKLAADELGRRWAEYNGLEGYQTSKVVIGTDGQPHIKFNVNGVWTDDPSFNGGRGGFDYGKMHDYLEKNGYIRQLDDAILKDMKTPKPETPKQMTESEFWKLFKDADEIGREDVLLTYGPAVFGKDRLARIAAKFADGETKKTKESGGTGFEDGTEKDSAGEANQDAVRSDGRLGALLDKAAGNANPDVPTSRATAQSASVPAQGENEESLEERAQKILANRKTNEVFAKAKKTEAEIARRAGITKEDSAAVRDIKIRALAMTDKLAGSRFKKINGEYYFWHPKANGGVWIAQDGSTWAVRDGQLVSAGGSTENAEKGSVLDGEEKFSPKTVGEMKSGGAEKSADVTFVRGSDKRRPTEKVRLEWDEDVLGATGPGGQGDLKKVGTRHVTQYVSDSLKNLLADMNKTDADKGIADGDTPARTEVNGKTVDTNARQQRNVEAFEETANGKEGAETVRREVAARLEHWDSEKYGGAADSDGDAAKASEEDMRLSRELQAKIDKMDGSQRAELYSGLSDFGKARLREVVINTEAERIAKGVLEKGPTLGAKEFLEDIDALETLGKISPAQRKRLKSVWDKAFKDEKAQGEKAKQATAEKAKPSAKKSEPDDVHQTSYELAKERIDRRKAAFAKAFGAGRDDLSDEDIAAIIENMTKATARKLNKVVSGDTSGRTTKNAKKFIIKMPSDGSDLSPLENERIKRKFGVDVNATA